MTGNHYVRLPSYLRAIEKYPTFGFQILNVWDTSKAYLRLWLWTSPRSRFLTFQTDACCNSAA